MVARNYRHEWEDGHNVPNLQTYDRNPYNAAYTQVVQRKCNIALSGRTDVPELNAMFDVVRNASPFTTTSIRRFTNDSGTLEFSVPEQESVQVKSDGTVLPERAAGVTDRWIEQYFRCEGGRLFVTLQPNTILEISDASTVPPFRAAASDARVSGTPAERLFRRRR